ncbi:DUF5906 domain-containing protein [Pseudomonas sp. F1_0610]|uniref:DUF5906 domain-containing protein n=1 Tax=Pseudomonas sp. F1_0610 TaxID=3114284 RepID=UPI0039C29FA6
MTTNDKQDLTLDEARSLLPFISAEQRDIWIQVGMGLKAFFGDLAFDLFDSWSQSGSSYKAADCRAVWRSFHGDGISIATVVKLAQDNGWRPEKRELTAQEKAQRKAEFEQLRAKREAELEADEEQLRIMREQVALACQEVFEKHCHAAGASQYLENKKVLSYGTRYVNKLIVIEIDSLNQRCQIWHGPDAHRWLNEVNKDRPAHISMLVMKQGVLVVPLVDETGVIQSLQVISANGKKMFPKFGRKSGCFHLIGASDASAVVAVAEGYATAASVHMCTGWPVAVAIDSGNIIKVCKSLNKLYADKQLVICGDDDPSVEGNPGRTKAEQAAAAYGAICIFPQAQQQGADWNDLLIVEGAAVATKQLEEGLENSLPHTPSNNGGAAQVEAAAAENGGEGDVIQAKKDAIDRKILARFALVEGKTDVWDGHKFTVMKKSGFEALVGKEHAQTWLGNIAKKLIDKDQAQLLVDQRKMQGKALKDGWHGMTPVERYVYIDGTKDIWDRAKRRRVPEGAVKMMLGDSYSLWLNAGDRKVVDMDHIVFDPAMQKDPDIYINTFEGLPLEPIYDDEKCKSIRELISFLCNDDPEATQWLTCWLAYPLQKLGTKMDTAVLLHSTMEGSGKSLFLSDIMGKIYGAYAATVGQAQLESNWTVWQSAKLYAAFEEVVSRDKRYNQTGKIKHMITGKTVRMESKFVNGWEEANYMNAVFLSNEIMPWPISENDRRMFVMWPHQSLSREKQIAVGAEIESDGVEAFYGYLLSYDCGDFDLRTKPPRTLAKERLIAMSRSSWENFIEQWRSGELGVPFTIARTQDLHDLYLEWCSRNKENTLSETKFSLFVSSKIAKSTTQIAWLDDYKDRRRSMMFVADEEKIKPTDLIEAARVGQLIREWRKTAWIAGWNLEKWEKCIGFDAPLDIERKGKAA